MIGEHFERTCDEAEVASAVFPHVVQRGIAASDPERPSMVPHRWEGTTDAAYRDLFEGPQRALRDELARQDCSPTSLAPSLTHASIGQALENYLMIDATLAPGGADRLAGDPAAAARRLAERVPDTLGAFRYGAERDLVVTAHRIAAAFTQADADAVRAQTREDVSRLAAELREEVSALRIRNGANYPYVGYGDGSPAFYGTFCHAWLDARASENVLLLSTTLRDEFCGLGRLSDGIRNGALSRNQEYARYYRMSDTELSFAVADIEDGIEAYLEKLATAFARDGGYETVKRAIVQNTAGLGALLWARPGCAVLACQALADAKADEARARFWDGVVMWSAVAISFVALATVVAAPAAAALGAVGLAAGIATTSAVIGVMATAASLASAA
jgi:hypothetical protein